MTKSWRHEKSGRWPLVSTATTNELVDYFLKHLTELAFGIRLFALVLLGLCLKNAKCLFRTRPTADEKNDENICAFFNNNFNKQFQNIMCANRLCIDHAAINNINSLFKNII